MKIDSLDAFLVRLPLKKTFRMADVPINHVESVFLRMRSGDYTGWSEVFPGNEPILTAAWSRGVFSVLTDCLLPRIREVGSLDSTERLEECLAPVKGNRHAKAALDMAWWDLKSRIDGKPLHETIGGTRDAVEVGLVFDRYEDHDRFLDDLSEAVEAGYRRITLKIRPGWDLQMLRAVRASFPLLMLQCDVEEGLDMEHHSDTIYRFDDFMPSLLEQPLMASEYVGHAMLQDALRTTIGLDESITNLQQAIIAIDLRSAGTFCLKAGKMGGLTTAKAIHDVALAADVDCYSGCDILTSVGYRFVLALGALPGCELPTDYVDVTELFESDPGVVLTPEVVTEEKQPEEWDSAGNSRETIHVVDGEIVEERPVEELGSNPLNQRRRREIRLWKEPGIGFDPDAEMIEALAAAKSSM